MEFEKRQQSEGLCGQGQDPRNCRRFWTLGSSWSLKRVNTHRDRGGRGRDSRNCPRFFNARSLRERERESKKESNQDSKKESKLPQQFAFGP